MKWLFWRYLRALAVVIYAQYIGAQFYDPTLAGLGRVIWGIIDPLMLLGLIIVTYYAYHRKRAVDSAADDRVTREYLEANGSFYLGVALLVGVLWNGIGFQLVDPPTDVEWLWTIIDISLPLLFFTTSAQLMKSEA